jgi:hypothetical protein
MSFLASAVSGYAGQMVDFDDLGGGPGKRKKKSVAEQVAKATESPFQKSAVERLAEEMKSPFANLDAGMKAALGIRSGLSGLSGLDKQLQAYEKSQERLKDVFAKSPSEKLLGDMSALDADNLGRHHRSLFEDMPPMPDLPPNPIFETNEHLEQVGIKIDALLDVQAKQAGLIDLLLKAQTESGKAQTRMAWWGLIIGFAGVAVAVLAIAL